VVEIAEHAVREEPSTDNLRALGAVLYRAGQHADAVTRLQDSFAMNPPDGSLNDWLFLAMAHHRLGHADEAKRWLAKVVTWCEVHRDSLVKRETWQRRLEIERLRREAQSLIEGQAPDKKP
jgi:hypothetical protein